MRSFSINPWNVGRAMLYGAAIGFVAAGFKLLAPWDEPHTAVTIAEELIGATLAFALLCGIAAALRNAAIQRLSPPENR